MPRIWREWQTGFAAAINFTPRQYVAKYGRAARQMVSPDGDIAKLMLSSEYNLLDVVRYYYGVNTSQEVLLPEVMEHPLTEKVTRLKLPVYFIMGKYDYMTSSSAAKAYYDLLQADKKEVVVFEESAHYPQFEEKYKFCEWMARTFLQNVQ
ncbi:alpha/beta hydrolase [Paenibacillus sp. CN-4]|uniref:alpha/beta hydrolase n=1 Tax=Paenibacillus nanchangensis TaxID=3348343 RepID=UPI00397AD8AA